MSSKSAQVASGEALMLFLILRNRLVFFLKVEQFLHLGEPYLLLNSLYVWRYASQIMSFFHWLALCLGSWLFPSEFKLIISNPEILVP